MKKPIAILCTLASVIGALWFCTKFIARLGICRKDHNMTHKWIQPPQENNGSKNNKELENVE